MTTPLLELRQLSFAYPDRRVLCDVDFSLHRGDRVALIGSNGAGKTTLLHLLVGLQRPSAGQVLAFGEPRQTEADFHPVRTRVGLLFQDSDDQLFCPTVLEDVAFGPLNLGRSPADACADAVRTLDTLGLAEFGGRVAYRLSAGEKRLVALATVLAMNPEVLLLDEPTSGLDDVTEQRLIEHLCGLKQAMLIVSHDQQFLERLVNRAVRLADGSLEEARLHRHPHTHQHTHLHLHVPDGSDAHHHDRLVPSHDDHHVDGSDAEYRPT